MVTINVLLCDTFPGLLPDYIPSYVSLFENLFANAGAKVNLRVFNAFEGTLPCEINSDDIYLIPGCMRGAYDQDTWIVSLKEWVVKAHRLGAKLLGVCFGHQLIAEALGGKVERSPKGWGTGVRQSQIVDSTVLAHWSTPQLQIMYNHNDQVVKLPTGATLVATSEFCPIESYRIGNTVLTFQGHPEYIPQYGIYLLDNHASGETEQLKTLARTSIDTLPQQGVEVARAILSFFNIL